MMNERAPGRLELGREHHNSREQSKTFQTPRNAARLRPNLSIMEKERYVLSFTLHGYSALRAAATALLLVLFSSFIHTQAESVQTQMIRPGDVWRDDRGEVIQAHAGAIIQIKGQFFWFGEDRSRTNEPDKRYISCYSSSDLVHWRFRNQVLVMNDPEELGSGWVLERPKIFYNHKTHKFVLYAHLDNGHYTAARVAVAVSDTVDGEYKYVRSFRPLGKESRDIGEFIDDDGAAYLIFESRPTGGFYIGQLSDDYMEVEKEIAFVRAPLEGGAIVRYDGLYYVIGSHLTGWNTNPNVYATASTLQGPWTEMKDIAPPQTNTYDSQSGMLIRVTGTKGTVVIYAGDRWNPTSLWDSRYVWLPVEIGRGQFRLTRPCPWSIDVTAGVASQRCAEFKVQR